LNLFHFDTKNGPGAKRIQELALTTSMQIVAAIHEAAQVINQSIKKYYAITGGRA
jgi:hypothetical protein